MCIHLQSVLAACAQTKPMLKLYTQHDTLKGVLSQVHCTAALYRLQPVSCRAVPELVKHCYRTRANAAEVTQQLFEECSEVLNIMSDAEDFDLDQVSTQCTEKLSFIMQLQPSS